jgi:hypothetical protein
MENALKSNSEEEKKQQQQEINETNNLQMSRKREAEKQKEIVPFEKRRVSEGRRNL